MISFIISNKNAEDKISIRDRFRGSLIRPNTIENQMFYKGILKIRAQKYCIF